MPLAFGVTVLYAFHLTWCEKQKGDSVKCQQDLGQQLSKYMR